MGGSIHADAHEAADAKTVVAKPPKPPAPPTIEQKASDLATAIVAAIYEKQKKGETYGPDAGPVLITHLEGALAVAGA